MGRKPGHYTPRPSTSRCVWSYYGNTYGIGVSKQIIHQKRPLESLLDMGHGENPQHCEARSLSLNNKPEGLQRHD